MSQNNIGNEEIVELDGFVVDEDENNPSSFIIDEDTDMDFDNSLIGSYLQAIAEDEDTTLTEVAMNKADNNDDEALKLAAVMGMDLSTGKRSTLENSISNILLPPQQETVSVNELGEEVETEIEPHFDEMELQRIRNILSNMFVFKTTDKVTEMLREKAAQAQEIMRTHMTLVKKRHAIQESGKRITAELKYHTRLLELLQKGSNFQRGISKQKVTAEELEEINRYEGDLLQVPIKVKTLREDYEDLAIQNKKINEQIEMYKTMEVNITKEIAEIKSRMSNLAPNESVHEKVDYVIDNHSKIVGIEFGMDMYSSEFRERPIAVKCSCGHVTITDIDHLPSYKTGNIFNYLKERTKINSNVKKNYFLNTDVVKSKELRHELIKEKNALEKRIRIPGITEPEQEPLKCEKCEKYMLFPPSALDHLTERSFGSERLAVELVASNKFKDQISSDFSLTLFLTKSDISAEYLKNLGLEEYRLRKINKQSFISTDALSDDSKSKDSRISERALKQYRRFDIGEFDAEEVKRELSGHIRNINLALDSLLKDFRIPKAKNINTRRRMSQKEQEKLVYKARKNKTVSNFIASYRYLIVLYAVSKGMSSQSITLLIKTNADKIKELKSTLFQFFVDYVIDSVIDGNPILEVERGSLGSVDLDKTNLPHANFFKCYKPLIRRFFLYGSISKIKNDRELKSHYNNFKAIAEISLAENYEEQLKKSEIFVKELRERMEEYYEAEGKEHYIATRNKMFLNYLSDAIELENNYDEFGRSQAWLHYEMRITGTDLKNTQLIDADLFAELYNDKLRSEQVNQ